MNSSDAKWKLNLFLKPSLTRYQTSSILLSVHNKRIESELKEVLDKLEYLARQKGALGLKESTYSSVGSASVTQIAINFFGG